MKARIPDPQSIAPEAVEPGETVFAATETIRGDAQITEYQITSIEEGTDGPRIRGSKIAVHGLRGRREEEGPEETIEPILYRTATHAFAAIVLRNESEAQRLANEAVQHDRQAHDQRRERAERLRAAHLLRLHTAALIREAEDREYN